MPSVTATTVDLTLTHEEFILCNALALATAGMLKGLSPKEQGEEIQRAVQYSASMPGLARKMSAASKEIVRINTTPSRN